MKKKIWREVKTIPRGTKPEDMLKIPGHKFIRVKNIWRKNNNNEGDKNCQNTK